ncbi:MAG: hypothetical protein ACF8XB_23165 [Planctomycetota bacterium JB042]
MTVEPRRIRDEFTPGETIEYDVRELLFEGRSEWQEIVIADLVAHGRTLFLDGNLQSAEFDEHLYHEALVQPAMLLVDDPGPRRVAILGGGEGATLREVLKHESVEHAVMVDLDGVVVDACREHLPGHHRGAFDDPRAEVVRQDAAAYLRDHDTRFDVLIFDIVDPADAGPAHHLFETPFLERMRDRLADGGVLAMQYGPAFGDHFDSAVGFLRRLREVFGTIDAGRVFVPAYHGCWGMVLAGRSLDDVDDRTLDRRLRERLSTPARSLDVATLRAQASLPRDLADALGGERSER